MKNCLQFKFISYFEKLNILGEDRYIVDAVVNDQGPNYILAKRLQHWRAIVSKEDGCLVSTNIAPATATASVVSNKLFALAYKGQHHFKPLEVSQQETSNAVMGMSNCVLIVVIKIFLSFPEM